MNHSEDAHEDCMPEHFTIDHLDHPEDASEVAYHDRMREQLISDHLEDAYEGIMPEHLIIGTQKALEKDCAFTYQKKKIGSETIYVCNEGSKWARSDEVLVLRFKGGTWTAYDSAVSADLSTLQCRQAVFRCLATDITLPKWHKWQINVAADAIESGHSVDWQGALWAETRVP